MEPSPEVFHWPGCISGFTRLQPGMKFSEHVHWVSTEFLIAAQGQITVVKDDLELVLTAGASTVIPPGSWHTVRNDSDEDATVVFVRQPDDPTDVFYRRDTGQVNS